MENRIIRETYEWSNIWWDNANDLKTPRVLLIGDSISVGYCPIVTKCLNGKFRVDRLSNSRAIHAPAHLKETIYMLNEFSYAAIHFNNGLHGFHLTEKEYAAGLRYYVELLWHESHGTPLMWASSTPITKNGKPDTLDKKRNGIVLRRNAAAAKIMKEFKIPVNDLYTKVVGKPDLRSPDGYHYEEKGRELQGQIVANALLKVLK